MGLRFCVLHKPLADILIDH